VIVILTWVYYSSQILLFGAEFTRVHARHRGSDIRPSPNALPVTPDDLARQGMDGAPEPAGLRRES
jgi:membrane protein